MKIFLTDAHCTQQLVPFTYTRHVADIRIGILTIREKWEKLTNCPVYTSLANKDDKALIINANTIPTIDNFQTILDQQQTELGFEESDNFKTIQFPWQLFQYNDWAIRRDFDFLTKNRISQPLSKTNKCIGEDNIFIEEGATVEHSIINASTGPVYIGKNSTIMEGCMIRGPFALCEGATLKMGTKIYGATTIGPFCVGGGEIKNSILFAFSNKAHDGYLGDSVIGAYCNLGAGTSNSNVKNTGGMIKMKTGKNIETADVGNKAGLLMGDYSRAAINTSFNTGTVVGVCCNIFGNETPAKFIDNFSWNKERYDFDKAIIDIGNWKKMKGQSVTVEEKEILKRIYTS